MMTIKRTEVTVGEITRGYVNNDEQGVRGYNGRLDIRPPYQREFIYSEKEQQAVINTVLHGYPLNVMYWVKRSDDAECPYEVMDGQQRTLSLCEYVDGKFSIDFKNFFNQPEDIQKKILDYPLTIYVCEGEPSEKLEWFKTINIAGKPLNEQEINNAIFRRGHISFGLSSALAGSGTVFDFNWYKINVMRTKTSGEDKELEALLMRQDIFVDYFDDIYVYGEKKRTTSTLNEQRGRWASQQFTNLFRNIRFLPGAIFRKQYNLADKLIQWMLVPRTNMIGIIMIMSLVLPFIYLTMAIKWWILGSLALFIFALATPDYLVDEMWDKTFLRSPFVSLWKMFNFKIHKKS